MLKWIAKKWTGFLCLRELFEPEAFLTWKLYLGLSELLEVELFGYSTVCKQKL